MSNYYVYIYLDPRKPGIHTYGDIQFTHEPIYVGKGTRNRIKRHLQQRTKKTSMFYYKLNKIIAEGYEPIYYKLMDKLTDDAALSLEVQWIACIGRKDIGTGPLCNCSEGGERGFTRTEVTRQKQREAKLGSKNPMYGKTTSQAQRLAVAVANKQPNKITEAGKEKIRMNNAKRTGTKNTVVRKDVIQYQLTSPTGGTYQLIGAREVQAFCKKRKMQYHTLMNNQNIMITFTETTGIKVFARNTLNWKLTVI